jgi:glycosyltransferase involved in cell wall biosynthesis
MPELKLSKKKSLSPSGELPLVSIIITNYNYEKFLPQAIDSALQQTYPKKEIIVVDDGSTDSSPHIINSYGDQIIPVFKENGGVVSATNAGFFASRGEIIFFLDSDDIFSPHKVETMVNYFLQVMPQNPEVLIFHRLEMMADDGISSSCYMPRRVRTLDGKKKTGLFEKLTDPETAYRYMQKWGFFSFISSATTGISLTRSLAGKIFPLPEERAIPQDECLVYASMLLGTIYGTSQILGSYFIHEKGFNLSRARSDKEIERYRIMENFLNDILEKMNKERIASFFESRNARKYYRRYGSTKDLIKLAWKIPGRCFCWETIRFSIQTLWYCLKSAIGIKKRYWDTKKKLLAKARGGCR